MLTIKVLSSRASYHTGKHIDHLPLEVAEQIIRHFVLGEVLSFLS